MTSYTISANGMTMGTYSGRTADEAVLAYVRDAGYASVEAAAEALGQTEQAFLADVTAEPGCGLTLTVETLDMSEAGIDCVEVRIERASRLVSKGRCYMGRMPSLESSVDRALEGAIGGALLAGVSASDLIAVAKRVRADEWSRSEVGGTWLEACVEYAF